MSNHRDIRLLQLFNRYRYHGGEEQIISNMTPRLREFAEVTDCFFESNDWQGPGAPPRWKQALLSLYNSASARRAIAAHESAKTHLWLIHNILPVGSPSIYHAALRKRIPVVQHVQNHRPFSITGTYWIGDSLIGPKLQPRLFQEALSGAWNGSVPQGLVMAAAMRLLLSSGWLAAINAWIGVSRSICSHLAEAGVPESKIHHIPPVWRQIPEVASISNRYDGGFLYLGRLIPEKGILTLLDTWRLLRDTTGEPLPRLTICGAGPLEPAVRKAAAENPAIQYAGTVGGEAKEALLSQCTALVVPSLWWDPNPTVVGEAYRYARPVLAASTGGLLDSVLDGETGFLHPPGDSRTLAAHVSRLAYDPGIALNFGRAGTDHLSRFTDTRKWKVLMRGMFERVLAENR